MCGIVGYSGFYDPGLIERMQRAITHRGPDGQGKVEYPDDKLGIAMQRLSIIDVSGGAQPFFSDDCKVALVFNGEIYNHNELREQLIPSGRTFRTRSDAEVVLQAYLQWGPNAWSHLSGMFAVAIVDRRIRPAQLLIVRDRTGIKPLYYSYHGERLLFASELKAILECAHVSKEIRLDAITDYLALRYVPGPRSLFKDIKKLPAGHYLSFSGGEIHIASWWQPPSWDESRMVTGRKEAIDLVGSALRASVRRHMISDVPVGAYLSGGVDSSLIVALMRECSDSVHTFSVRMSDADDYDADTARVTANFLGADHSEIECRHSDMSNLSDIAYSLDEPIGDAIVVPMYILAREARQHVKVVLSGEGADELFGGYLFHRKLAMVERIRQHMPVSTWKVLAHLTQCLPPWLIDRAFDYPASLGTEGRQKILTLLNSLGSASLDQLYLQAISLFDTSDLAKLLKTTRMPRGHLNQVATFAPAAVNSPLQRLVDLQYSHWLPDDILMKLDKITMAHSLEGRVPFLDPEVIDASYRIPDRFKLSRKSNKWVLREFASSVLPHKNAFAPKRAFYIPLESYMNTKSLRDQIEWALNPARIQRRGLYNVEYVQSLMNAPASAGFLPLKRLFSLLMLELWFERFSPDASWN